MIHSYSIVVLALCSMAAVQASDLVLSMNDSSILYSPYNWGGQERGIARTINSGAYFRVQFTGTSCVLHTDTSAMPDMFSQIWTRVDGGPLQQHVLSTGNPSLDVSFGPPFTASNNHLLEVIVKSTTETRERWAVPSATAVIFTGITIGNSTAPPRRPVRKPYNVLIYGDSITEGVRTLGYVGIANDTDRNDAVRDYSYQLSQMLPIEIGVVGFGATGTTKPGSGGVPALPETWDKLWDGEPRVFMPAPDVVIYNEGTNDGKSTYDTLLAVVKGVAARAPNTVQLLMLPFNGCHEEDILKVVAEMASPRVVFGNTTGFYDGADGLHPFGYSHVGMIAPRMAGLVAPLLPVH